MSNQAKSYKGATFLSSQVQICKLACPSWAQDNLSLIYRVQFTQTPRRSDEGWSKVANKSAYMYPDGFTSEVMFGSSQDLGQRCLHTSFIIGEGGRFWPHPTFRVVAADMPGQPEEGITPSACWTKVLFMSGSLTAPMSCSASLCARLCWPLTV